MRGSSRPYESYIMYGSKRMPKQRGLQEIDLANGLVTGFRGREANVPPGYCTRLQNFVPRNDGTYDIRPPFFVGPAWDSEAFDPETVLASTVVATFPDGGVLTVLEDQTENDLFIYRTGFTPASGGIPSGSFSHFGNGAHWGNVTIIPFVRYLDGDPNEALVGVWEVEYDPSDLTMSVATWDLTTLFDHQPYVYQDVDVAGSAYGRSFALTWKGRGFILAGTGISFSAPLQPGEFEPTSGGGFIPLDTHAPIVGAFILQDIMYICTESELFTLSYELDPGRDRQIRTLSRIRCFGAMEHDNVGYIAARQGLYRVVSNQLLPTFLPSDQNYFNTKVTADLGGNVYPLNTDSVYIPRVCGLHRFGDLIVFGGLGFNADRRFGTPAGDTYRYPAFSTTTETWVEWTGPSFFDGGIFSPVNAHTLSQGPLTPNYGFPASHVMQMFEDNISLPESRPAQAFMNINTVNEALTILRDTTIDPGLPITLALPPYLDVSLDILFPSTEDEVFAVDVESSAGFEVFLMTGRMTFGAPMTWKRLHRYWIEANLYGAGALADNSFMFWRFFTPFEDEESFSETEHNRTDSWLPGTDSMQNQTPGHLLSRDDPTKVSRFTSAQLALYWRSPLALEDPEPLNTNLDFEDNVDGWAVDNGDIVQSGVEAFDGSFSGLVASDGSGILVLRTDPEFVVVGGNPYSLDYFLFVPAGLELSFLGRFVWLDAEDQVVGTTINEFFDAPDDEWFRYIFDTQAPVGSTKGRAELEVQKPLPELRSFSTGFSNGDTTFQVAAPAELEEGDLVAIFLTKELSGGMDDPTSGPWDKLGSGSPNPTTSSANNRLHLWLKQATDSEPANYEFTVPFSDRLSTSVTILAIKDAEDSVWDFHNNAGFIFPEGVRTPSTSPSRGSLEIRYVSALVDDFTGSAPGGLEFITQEDVGGFYFPGHALFQVSRDTGGTTPQLDIPIPSTEDTQREGVTLNFLRKTILATSDEFHIDSALVSITPSVVEFDGDTPKWTETGVGRIYADITEYKPSHTGI